MRARYGRITVSNIVRRIFYPLARHPLVATGILAGAIAAGHAIWIYNNRHLGGIDPDESGYLTAALSFQRSIDPAHPTILYSTVTGNATAPLVPLLSVVLLIVGPRSVWTAMMIQPVLMVVGCVAIAGITRRFAGSIVAIAAGVSFALTPTVIHATQSYWLGLGAATSFVCALWALLASDRGSNRWIWVYGAGLGAMMLSRTMMLGMLPAALLAGLIVCRSTKRSIARFVGAATLGAVLAGPWWYSQWTWTIRYLTSYGYGKRAGLFGQGDLWERVSFRFTRVVDVLGFGWSAEVQLLAILGIALGLLGLLGCLPRWVPVRTPVRSVNSEVLALTTAVVAAFAALVSTTNNGVWFELPMIAAGFPLVWGIVGRGPIVGKVLAVSPFALFAVFVLPSAWFGTPISHPFPGAPTSIFPTHFEYGFSEYDNRFAPENRSEQATASAEWWAASQGVERALREIAHKKPNVIFYMSGNFEMMNTNSVLLAAELDSWSPTVWVPDTTVDAQHIDMQLSSLAADLDGNTIEPRRGSTFERVVVLLEHGYHLFTPDAQVAKFAARARELGWIEVEKFDLPRGGTASILRMPEK